MSTYYLIRMRERDINLDEDERLYSIDSESDTLDFAVNAMKDSDCRILNIIEVNFRLYGEIVYKPLELMIVEGRFKLMPVVPIEK